MGRKVNGRGNGKPGRPVGTRNAKPKKKTGRVLRGLNALPPEERRVVKQIQHISIKQVAEIASLVISVDIEELGRIADAGQGESVLKVWYANIARTSIENGDVYALNGVLDRVIGRVKEHIEISTPDGNPITMALISMTQEERLKEIERLRANRKLAELE